MFYNNNKYAKIVTKGEFLIKIFSSKNTLK